MTHRSQNHLCIFKIIYLHTKIFISQKRLSFVLYLQSFFFTQYNVYAIYHINAEFDFLKIACIYIYILYVQK